MLEFANRSRHTIEYVTDIGGNYRNDYELERALSCPHHQRHHP